MQYALIGQTNVLSLPIVAKASGNAITTGVVNFCLIAKDGVNAGKWYRGSDLSWQAIESIAGVATHLARGHWELSFPSTVWTEKVRYRMYGYESGDLHIPVGEDVISIKSVADAVHDEIIEGTLTQRQATRLLLAILTGKSSGGGGVELTFRDVEDTKDRFVVTVDKSGNRTVIDTRDGS